MNIVKRIGLVVLLAAPPALALAQTGGAQLAGTWLREGEAPPGLEDVAPPWEAVSVEPDGVSVTRSTTPLQPRRLVADGVERVTDTGGARHSCRSNWERQRLVTECRTTGGGPGGQAPLLLTREVRWVDETGAMLVELTWQSDDHATTRTTRYRKAELK